MAEYSIHDTTLVAASSAIRAVEGSSELINPEDYPKHLKLMGPLPKGKASGAIAHITDGASDVPTSSCEVTIAPTLTGVSSVSVTRTGKNLAEISDDFKADGQKILYSYADGGIVCTADGTYSRIGFLYKVKIGETYTFTYTASSDAGYRKVNLNTSVAWTGQFYSNAITEIETTYSKTFTATSETLFVGFYVTSTTTTGTMTVKNVQLEVGSTSSTYEEYNATTYTASLGRTIYGGNVDIVNGTGTDKYSVPTALNSLAWNKTTIGGHDCFYANLTNGYIGAEGLVGDCDSYDITTDGQMGTDKTIRFYNSTSFNFSRVSIRDDQYANYTGAQFKEAVTGNIVYLLAESARTDFTFTGVEVPTRLGINNFFSNLGDTELEYRKDINLALGTNKYRYLKWVITATRTTSSYCQMSDIEFSDANNNKFTFPTGTTVTADTTATSGTGTAYIIDGNTSTKFCGNWKTGGITITIDLGIGNTIDVTQYKKFSWYTANDANDRDPITWELYGIDVSNSPVLLCSRTAYTPTTDRKALADTVNITSV